MDIFKYDEENPDRNDVEEATNILIGEECEGDQQSPVGTDVEETPIVVDGDHLVLKGNDAEETPTTVDSEECEGDRQSLKENDVEETPSTTRSDGVPYIGMKFYSEDEAYLFYNEYAARIGFSIRKGGKRYNAKGVLRQRNFVCSKEGLKLDDDTCGVKKSNKLDNRTDCKARIRFTVTDGVWEVTHFNPHHNHELAEPEERKFLRSNRKVLEANLLTSMVSALHCKEAECDGIPNIGMKVYSEDEAYNFYNEYAMRVGFSIRKGITRYNSKGLLRQRNYMCSKQGLKLDDDASGVKKCNKLETRTDCKASIRFTVTDGVWEITNFNPNHNHELVEPEQRRFLRSNRKVSKAIGGCITPIVSAGVRPANSCSSLTEVNRSDIVGCTPRDLMDVEKLNTIDAGDAQCIINYFKHKLVEDLMFFYTLQVDKKNRMTNFFWRDGRSRMDYDCFEDVIVFDTTFRSDKYNVVCAPFIGVNHHGKDVSYGCAFLLDETVPSFIWLFETFLESMGNRQPKTIFTNQCTAMATAIEKVFPKTCHRRCLWQIWKNAKQHLSTLYSNPEFKTLFNRCLDGCCTEMEFQSAWDELIERHNLQDNKWLKELYEVRQKWCPTFSLDTFSASMRSTQRIESTNNVFHHMSCNTMNLIQLVIQYEEMTKQMRLAELEEDFRCDQELPTRASRSSGMLKQAADVYTIEIFRLFQEEMVESLSIVMNEQSNSGTLQMYELTEEGQRRAHIVHFNPDNCTVECSCKMFESMGLLCRHALRVLNMKNVTQIPAQYILKRWTKSAKKGMMAPDSGESSCNDAKFSPSLLRRKLMYKAFCAVDKSLMTTVGSEIADNLLDRIFEQAESYITTLNVLGDIIKGDSEPVNSNAIDDTNGKNCLLDELPVLDPAFAGQKGAKNDRAKCGLEKKRKRKALKSNTTTGQAKQLQTSVGPSGTSLPPQVTTFFLPSFHPSGVGVDANSYNLPSFHQGHFPTWAIGGPNFRPTGVFQGTGETAYGSQDSSTRLGNHTSFQMPPSGNGTS